MSFMESIKNFLGLSNSIDDFFIKGVSELLENNEIVAVVSVHDPSKTQEENTKALKNIWKYITWAGFSYYKAVCSYYKHTDGKKIHTEDETYVAIYCPVEKMVELQIFCSWLNQKCNQEEYLLITPASTRFFFKSNEDILNRVVSTVTNFHPKGLSSCYTIAGKFNFSLKLTGMVHIEDVKMTLIEQTTSKRIRKELFECALNGKKFSI